MTWVKYKSIRELHYFTELVRLLCSIILFWKEKGERLHQNEMDRCVMRDSIIA